MLCSHHHHPHQNKDTEQGTGGRTASYWPALGTFFHAAPPPHPVLVGLRKIPEQGPWLGLWPSAIPFFHAEELERARASSGTQQGAARLWGRIWGEPFLFQRVWGSPSTVLCTPAAFQAKSPPAHCMSPAGARRRHFSLCSSQAPERSSASPSNDVQTPAALICSLGFWPPHRPAAPGTSPLPPLPPSSPG